jgi:serine/threonine-protein kinase
MTDLPHPERTQSAAAALSLEGACARFEQAWQAGGRPRLEEFIGPGDGREYPALLKELVALDVHYRRRAGESPRPEDYAGRFPGFDPAGQPNLFAKQAALAETALAQWRGP